MDGVYSNVGAVVGATYPEMGKVLRGIMPHAFILVPGYGAQGGKGKDLVHFFDRDGLGAIVNSSRGIIAAWKSDSYKEFADGRVGEAARAAALDMQKDIADTLAH
jgi:orotidine-5'-phosphate decarboxylase